MASAGTSRERRFELAIFAEISIAPHLPQGELFNPDDDLKSNAARAIGPKTSPSPFFDRFLHSCCFSSSFRNWLPKAEASGLI